MKGQILAFFVFCAALSVIFASPLQQNVLFNPQPNYANIPRCLQPRASGLCLAYFPSYYYNPGTKTCEQFIYGGCQGNENRFLTFDECMSTCEGAEPEEQEFKLVLPSETIDPCSMPSDSGPCRAGIPRFYFNGEKCDQLLYGGCGGNENNFKTIEECQQRCGPKSSEETEEVKPSSEKLSEEVVENKSEEVAENKSEEVAENKSEEVAENKSEEVAAEPQSSEEVAKNE